MTKKQNQDLLKYVVRPLLFLSVTLIGGLRFALTDNSFLFVRPHLVCLIFATVLIVLFFRAGLMGAEEWFSNENGSLTNLSTGFVLLAIFGATTQVFNSLIPERGLPFWIVAFCFMWTLWNNLFLEFGAKRLLQSLAGLFGLAFVIKYLVLAGLAAPANESWWQGILQNPTQQAFTWLLDLPRYSSATGYLQFVTIVTYIAGLLLLSPVAGTLRLTPGKAAEIAGFEEDDITATESSND